jgi:ABC-2 type transport system permease protein
MSGGVRAIAAVWWLVGRTQLSRARLVALAAGGVVLVALTWAVAAGGGDAEPVLDRVGVDLLVPLLTLVVAASALGDLDADGSLVYLWLRPVPRWQLAVGALGAVGTIAVPAVMVPIALAALVAGLGAASGAVAAATGAATALAYGAVFLAAGLWLERALLWGLLYVLVWEGPVSAASDTLARLSVRWHADAALEGVLPVEAHPAASSAALAGFVVAGLVATTWLLRRHQPT